MSNKNILQEHCVKFGYPFPVYDSISSGLPHKLSWQSHVIIQGHKFYSDQPSTSKVDAEQNAAGVALKYLFDATILTPTEELKEVYIHKFPDWIVLVDVENLQPTLIHGKPVSYYIFMSEFSSIDRAKYQSPISEVILVDSSNSDAADHLMSYYAGKLTKTLNVKNYIILSRDKASATLATLLTMDGFNVKHFKDVSSMNTFIGSM